MSDCKCTSDYECPSCWVKRVLVSEMSEAEKTEEVSKTRPKFTLIQGGLQGGEA